MFGETKLTDWLKFNFLSINCHFSVQQTFCNNIQWLEVIQFHCMHHEGICMSYVWNNFHIFIWRIYLLMFPHAALNVTIISVAWKHCMARYWKVNTILSNLSVAIKYCQRAIIFRFLFWSSQLLEKTATGRLRLGIGCWKYFRRQEPISSAPRPPTVSGQIIMFALLPLQLWTAKLYVYSFRL